MERITTYLSILAVNVNVLNSPIKKCRLASWIKNQDPIMCFYKKCISQIKTNIGIK
jgi:hypothetical protein